MMATRWLRTRIERLTLKRPTLSVGAMVFVALMCLSLVGLDGWRTWKDREDDLRDAGKTTANLTGAIAQHAGDTIRAADALLVMVTQQIRTAGTDPIEPARLRASLVASAEELPQLIGLFVYDEAGRPIASSIETKASAAERDYFAFHRDHPSRALHISHPIIDEVSGTWSIPVSRRLEHADGSFAGVAAAAVDADYFLQFYNTFQIGKLGAIVLALDDGTVLVRRPFVEKDIGKNLSSGKLFEQALKTPIGTFTVNSRFDHVVRILSYRRLEEYPLVVNAALAEDEILAPWYEDARSHGIGVAALVTTLGFLGYRLSRQIGLRAEAEKSARKAAAAALRAAEEAAALRDHYRLLADHSTDMICRIGPDGVRRYVSPASRSLLGFEPEELEGQPVSYLQHPDDMGRLVENVRRALGNDDHRSTVSYRMRRKDGRYIWVEATLRFLRDPATGEPREMITAVRDITSRMEAEARLHDAVESIDDGFILCDEAARLIMCNARYRALFHLDAELVQAGMPMQELFVAEARAGQHGPIADTESFANEMLTTMRADGDAAEHLLADGRWILCSNRRMATGGWVGIRTDISAQKRRESELAQSRSQLEHQASSLRDLARDLSVAKVEAENANRLKSEFLATVSHEIRTPMNGIIGMNELLLGTTLDGQQRRFADTVRVSANALMVIINDILDVSKLEAGRVELEHIDFDLGTTVDEAVELMRPRASEKGLLIESRVPAEARRPLRGDPTRLRQVLLNLLANAIKFTERGGVEVTVETRPRGPGQAAVRVEVHDTGIGVREADKPKLFKKFQQADGSITRRFGGTGLGLNISAQLLALMGGEIGITDREGGGSIFWFELTLPLGEAAVVAEPAKAASRTEAAGGRKVRKSGHILLAEDNAINRDLATLILEAQGYTVASVPDGLAAVDAAQSGEPDLILMDVHMPKLDGLQATQRIRALGGLIGAVPIVAMTANAMKGDQKLCLDAGMVDYVAKPIDTQSFLATVDRWLKPRAAAAPSPVTEMTPPPAIEDSEADDGDGIDAERLRLLESVMPRDRLAALVAEFLAGREAALARLREFERANDLAGLRAEAHSLTGLAGNLGARRLQLLAEELHAACVANAPHQIGPVLNEIETAWRRVKPYDDTAPPARGAPRTAAAARR